jgi:1-acyl-sn-glycerol-3-phosphate acyltransferase
MIFINILLLSGFIYSLFHYKTFFKNILYLIGYKINILENLPSKLIIISSHTSIYDFIIGLLFYYGYLHDTYSTYVLMKKSFEEVCYPLFTIMDNKIKIIGVQTEYKTSNRITEKISNVLKEKDNYILFISPEGTRKCTNKIKSGYWYISKNVDAYIMFLGIDYVSKNITMENYRKPFETWNEEEKDFIHNCQKYIPLYPECCFWNHYLLESSELSVSESLSI